MFRVTTAKSMKLVGRNFIKELNFVNWQLVIDNRFANYFKSIVRDIRRIIVAR
jgi:hypothetical protein